MGDSGVVEKRLPYHDSWWSWTVAAACGWCFFWLVVVNRCGGIIYVSMVTELGASREAASWPILLLSCVSLLMAIPWRILMRYLTLRKLYLIGTVLTATGILLCAVFFNITAITICCVITAIGQGLIFPSSHVALNTAFRKYRASATGLCYVGGTLASFVFPPIILVLNESYGLRGTLLIVGACSLNSLAGALLISRPGDHQPKTSSTENSEKLLKAADTVSSEKQKLLPTKLRNELSFLKSPMYFAIAATSIVFTYNWSMFNVTIVDYGIEKGHSKWKAALLLSCLGAGDFIGRVLSGQISDRKVCERRHVMVLALLVMTTSMAILVYSNSLGTLGTVSFVFGAAGGSVIILFSVLFVEYFGLQRLPMAIGLANFTKGIALFPRPFLIGYYRDRGNSYGNLYVLLAVLSLGTTIVWVVECVSKWRQNRRARRERNAIEKPPT